jgi:glycosyltransferase involved in cell wall biosynthesis
METTMRILMVTDFYQPFLGGVEQHVRSLSAELVARGHEVAVATLWSEGLTEFEIDLGVRVYRIHSTTQRATRLFSHPGRRWAPPFPDPEVLWNLRHVVKREQPDIVHGHDWLARSFLPLKAWSGAKFVMSLHYYTLSCAKKSLMYHGAPCSGPGFIKCLECGADHYGALKGVPIVLGNGAMTAAEQVAVDMFLPVSQATAVGNGLVGSQLPFQVIPNFVPDDVRIPRGTAESYLAQLPSDGYLVFVGDLRRFKGINVLLRAYAGLTNAPPLVLIGKVWEETPTDFPPNVVVLKNWPNHAIMEAWRRSMVALVPSIWPEPFGIVVIEAMASGRPVIASHIGGIPDIVVDGETGLLVPPGDSEALRSAIQHLLADPELRERMGQAAKRKASEFQASAVVPHIEQVYSELLPSEKHSSQQDPVNQSMAGVITTGFEVDGERQ